VISSLLIAVFSVINVLIKIKADVLISVFFNNINSNNKIIYLIKPTFNIIIFNLLYNGSLII